MDPNLLDEQVPEPANLKFLRTLVTVLTATMIGGLVIIITLLVIRLTGNNVTLPDHITLPKGKTAVSYTLGPSWYGVVTTDSELLIFDPKTHELRKTIKID